MDLTVDPAWLLGLLLVFVRAIAWLAVVPPFSNRKVVPAPALVGIAGGLAVLAVHNLPPGSVPTTTAGLAGSLVLQVLSGFVLGLSVQILLAAVSSAGSLIDLFGGINLPPSMDPLSQSQTPLFGQLYEQVALVLLFATNAEMLLVKGFVASFGGHAMTLQSTTFMSNLFTSDLATYFVATLEIAAPLVAVLFAAQIGLALLSRSAPQLNVWILGFPVQALLSLAFVAIGVRVLPGYLQNIMSRVAQDMTALMGGH